MNTKTVSKEMQAKDFQPTELYDYELGSDKIRVEIENSMRGLFWRMTVNGLSTRVSGHYSGITVLSGYGLVTPYFEGDFEPFVPFLITHAQAVK